jgi:predicted PurR-regulated permease PerM
LPGWLALVLTVAAVVGVLARLLVLIFVGFSQLAVAVPTYNDTIAARSAELSAAIEDSTTVTIPTVQPAQVSNVSNAIVAALGSMLVQIGTTLLIFIFMISAAITIPRSSRSNIQIDLPIVSRISAFTHDVRLYMQVTTKINLLVGLGNTILLLILGVDFALLWGILAWLLGYIPAVGFWIALIPPTLLAWAEFGPTTALIVFLGYVLINGTAANFIQPKMMGENLNISPVVVFLSLFIWGWLLGPLGAILAIPLTLLVLAFLDSFENSRWLAAVMRMSAGGAGSEERQEARERVGGLWERAKSLARFGDGGDGKEVGERQGALPIDVK